MLFLTAVSGWIGGITDRRPRSKRAGNPGEYSLGNGMEETGFESDVLGSKVVEQLFFFYLYPLLLLSVAVVLNSLRPHGLQHARLPCPSPSSRVCSNSCPLSQRCHPTISSSFASFSSCLQSFPASGSFLVSQLFTSGGQSTGASASTSVLSMHIQG